MYTTIEIDFDVYKEITVRRKTPRTLENDVIRELLGLPPAELGDAHSNNEEQTTIGTSWVGRGLTLPDGTELRAKRGGRLYQAKIENGAIVYDGKRYKSPSAAAGAITGNPVNGWTFWECKMPGKNDWAPMARLRKNEQSEP